MVAAPSPLPDAVSEVSGFASPRCQRAAGGKSEASEPEKGEHRMGGVNPRHKESRLGDVNDATRPQTPRRRPRRDPPCTC